MGQKRLLHWVGTRDFCRRKVRPFLGGGDTRGGHRQHKDRQASNFGTSFILLPMMMAGRGPPLPPTTRYYRRRNRHISGLCSSFFDALAAPDRLNDEALRAVIAQPMARNAPSGRTLSRLTEAGGSAAGAVSFSPFDGCIYCEDASTSSASSITSTSSNYSSSSTSSSITSHTGSA